MDGPSDRITEEIRERYYRSRIEQEFESRNTVELEFFGLVDHFADPVYEFDVAGRDLEFNASDRLAPGRVGRVELREAFTTLVDGGTAVDLRFGEALSFGECEVLDYRNETYVDEATIRCSDLPVPVDVGFPGETPRDRYDAVTYGSEEPMHVLNSYLRNDCKYAVGTVEGPVDADDRWARYEVTVESALADFPPSSLRYEFDVTGGLFDRLVRAAGGDPNHLPGFEVAVYPTFVPNYDGVDHFGVNEGSGVWKLALIDDVEAASRPLSTRLAGWIDDQL